MSWFQIGAAKAACATRTWAKSSGSALRMCRLSVMPVSPAMTKKMISFVSRNCSKLSAKGWRHEIIADLGSGLDYKKKGLQRLLELILFKRIHRLVLTHKDRLLRFGSELIFALCEIQNIEIVIITKTT